MALTVSLTIDQSLPAHTPSPPPIAARPPTTTPAPATSKDAAPAEIPRAESWSLYAGLAAAGSVHAAPGPSAGGVLVLGAAWRGLSLDLEGRADAPTDGAGEVAATRVRMWLVRGSVVPCGHHRAAFVCIVLSGGIIGASAPDAPRVQAARGPWSGLGGRLGAEWAPWSRLRLRAQAELLGVMTRDTFWIDATRVFTVQPWTGTLSVTALWQFR